MKINRDAEIILSHSMLLLYLDYNPENGFFYWKINPSMGTKAGTKAGTIHNRRCIVIGLKNVDYYAHRLAWFYVHKIWPIGIIDHIDRNAFNNAISNLRDTTYRVNNYNKDVQKRNTSGQAGVTFVQSSLKWRAQIRVNKKLIHLGCFSTREMAIQVRQDAEKRYA